MFTEPSIIGSWSGLADRVTASGAFDQWVTAEPVLTRVGDVHGLLAATAAGVPDADSDAVLAALVRIAAVDGGDDPDAVLVMLHLLANGIRRIAAGIYGRSATRDALTLVVGEVAIGVRSFPWQRRSRAIAANLLLDAKQRLTRREGRVVRAGLEATTDPQNTQLWDCLAAAFNDETGAPAELLDLLMWAERSGIAAADDLALLVEVVYAQDEGGDAQARVAAARGISDKTLRRRRERTLTDLRTAAGDYLSACA